MWIYFLHKTRKTRNWCFDLFAEVINGGSSKIFQIFYFSRFWSGISPPSMQAGSPPWPRNLTILSSERYSVVIGTYRSRRRSNQELNPFPEFLFPGVHRTIWSSLQSRLESSNFYIELIVVSNYFNFINKQRLGFVRNGSVPD